MKKLYQEIKQSFKENKESALDNASWFLGIICLVNAFKGLFVYPIIGLALFIPAFIFIPPIDKFISLKLNIKIPLYFKLLIFVGVALFICFIGDFYYHIPTPN
jgi:hypothetical protein